MSRPVRFRPLGEAALTVELGNRISPAINARVHALHAAVAADPITGVVEAVPAYSSLTLYYDPLALSLDALRREVTARLAQLPAPAGEGPGRLHRIPVSYGGEYGPDLDAVAAETDLMPEQVIEKHSQTTYRVYMLGFSPGFPYMGLTPKCLEVARLPTPRTRVPVGSVAIAGRQTGLYPSGTPGGWRLLGWTAWKFFDPHQLPPARLRPGDQVRFYPASLAEMRSEAEGEAGGEPSAPDPLAGRPGIEVLDDSLLTTVQDKGRFGFQSYGVPVSGAMDRAALHAANRLVGNEPDTAALEITLSGPRLCFLEDALIAVTGADLEVWVEWPDGNRWQMPGWMAIYMRRGSYLGFGTRHSGCRAYVAVAGGIRVPEVLGSASTCLAGAFGGHEGRRLQAGDRLWIGALGADMPIRAGRRWPQRYRPDYSAHPIVRVLPGPQWHQFPQSEHDKLFSAFYEVQPAFNRTGLRLAGPALQRRRPTEVISSGVTIGSIQVPNDGQPIVLGADRQTAGGYAQIAIAIQADLPLLAQLVPGDRVSFCQVTVEEAIAAMRQQVEQEAAACKTL